MNTRGCIHTILNMTIKSICVPFVIPWHACGHMHMGKNVVPMYACSIHTSAHLRIRVPGIISVYIRKNKRTRVNVKDPHGRLRESIAPITISLHFTQHSLATYRVCYNLGLNNPDVGDVGRALEGGRRDGAPKHCTLLCRIENHVFVRGSTG